MSSRIELRTIERSGFVQVDGVDISAAVRAVRFCADAGEVARVVIELAAPNITAAIDGAKVGLPCKVREALIALGWTPPEGSA